MTQPRAKRSKTAPVRRRNGQSKTSITKKQVIEITTQFRNSTAQLTRDQFLLISSSCESYIPTVKLALATLMKTGQEMIDIATQSEEGAVANARVSLACEDYLDKLEKMQNLIRTAATRCEFSLCYREDIKQIMARAKAEAEADALAEAEA